MDKVIPRVLDLFCGAGGISSGFVQAGYDVVAGVDFSPPAVETFENNHPNGRGLVADLTQAPLKEIEKVCEGDVHVIVGGPSCQGFSTAGGLTKQRGREETDPRNHLFLEYVRIVDHFRPSWVVFENVPGLLLYRKGSVALQIVDTFKEIGYNLIPMILLAADYGVPQLRRRLVFIGNRHGSDVHFPAPTHGDPSLWKNYSLPFAHLSRLTNALERRLPHMTFGQACGDLPFLKEGETIDNVSYGMLAETDYQKLMRKNSDVVRQHRCSNLAKLDRYAAENLLPGQNWRSLIGSGALPQRFDKIRRYDATTMLKRLEYEKPSYTITTKFHEATTGAFIHPTQPRTLSVREAARLQSFADDFVFTGKFGQVRTQIGNALPPLLARAIGSAILPSVKKDAFKQPFTDEHTTLAIKPDLTHDEILCLKNAGKTQKNQKRAPLKAINLVGV